MEEGDRQTETADGRGGCMHSHPIIIHPVVPSLALSLIGNKQLRVKKPASIQKKKQKTTFARFTFGRVLYYFQFHFSTVFFHLVRV